MFIIIISVIIFRDYLGWDTLKAGLIGSGAVAIFFSFLTSDWLKNKIQYKSIKGYWQYYIKPFPDSKDIEQKVHIPRIVIVDDLNNELRFQGWICDKPNTKYFTSIKVLLSALGLKSGNVVYWYNEPTEASREFKTSGFVSFTWDLKYAENRIDKLSGHYMGTSLPSQGSLDCYRISEEEFNELKTFSYL